MSPDPAPVWKAAPLGQRVHGMGDGQAGLETFGTDDIERAVGEVSYLRGLDYFVRGMVRSVEFGPAGRIYGEVSGSRPKPYAVAVKYEFGSDGTLLPVEGHCSCPVGYNCKHTVAVLLAARHVSPGGGRRRRRDSSRGRFPRRPPLAGRMVPGRSRQDRTTGRPVRRNPAGTICST